MNSQRAQGFLTTRSWSLA